MVLHMLLLFFIGFALSTSAQASFVNNQETTTPAPTPPPSTKLSLPAVCRGPYGECPAGYVCKIVPYLKKGKCKKIMVGQDTLVLSPAVAKVLGQIKLRKYRINPKTVTVSGISSGACMAHQYHVIYSGEVAGVATFAGVVYRCAEGLFPIATAASALSCTKWPLLDNVRIHENEARDSAAAGEIDAVSGMSSDKVYIFQGQKDSVVAKGNGDNLQTFYRGFRASIKYEKSIEAGHCQPTDYYGPSCDTNEGEHINNCSFNGAYEALNYMLGGRLTRPDNKHTPLPGLYTQFDQVEFFGDTYAASMDDSGYLYVPSRCVGGSTQCDLHVVFHGCQQGRQALGNDNFVRNTGYLQLGEVNNIIMLFPQVTKTFLNPFGCWDWWGYTSLGLSTYAKNTGVQPMGIRAMVQRLIYGI